MLSPIQFIEVRGVKREVLITPSLYKIVKERGWEIKVDSDFASIQSGYIKLIYAGVLNFHQTKKYDNPEIEDCDVTLIDVEIWAALHSKEFTQMISEVFELLTGKPLKEVVVEKEQEKKKSGHLSGIIRKIFS